MYASRVERLIRKTSWGETLDQEMIVNVSTFIASLMEREKLRPLSDVPTGLSEDEVRKFTVKLMIMDAFQIEKFPLLNFFNWEYINAFEKKLTPLGIVNGIIKTFLGEEYKMILCKEDDGTVSYISIRKDNDERN